MGTSYVRLQQAEKARAEFERRESHTAPPPLSFSHGLLLHWPDKVTSDTTIEFPPTPQFSSNKCRKGLVERVNRTLKG